jgi:8-oxo-dGTP pyrophosphatase MutT (NUDIX family)
MNEGRRDDLYDLLQSYAPVDARESEHRRRMMQLLESGPDPFARTCYKPGHFTASAFVLAPQDDTILLVFHARLQKWLQPGGHIDPSDRDVFAAARREAQEETGIELEESAAPASLFDLDIHSIPARPNEPAHEHFDVRTLWITSQHEVRPGSDALDVRWHSLEGAARMNVDESLGRALQKLKNAGFPPPSRR